MKKIIIPILAIFMLISCSDDEKSSNADIISMEITGFSDQALVHTATEIIAEEAKVYIYLDNDLTQHTFPIHIASEIILSSGAKAASIVDGELSFSNIDEVKKITITAEDGNVKDWYIFIIHKQIQNHRFENWYTGVGMNGKSYTEIGNSAIESLWATANMGTSMYTVYCTQPKYETANTLAEIKTGQTGLTAENSTIPITAGTLFTGRFNIAGAIANPTDPKKATDFGIPFRHKPTAIKVKYKYQAGEKYIQATLNSPTNIFGGFTVTEIEGEDQCSIYAILEKRSGDSSIELARAQLDSGTTPDILTEFTIPFNYTSTENPTHITIVFTSSIDGDLWRGAVGSTLIVDDLQLVY